MELIKFCTSREVQLHLGSNLTTFNYAQMAGLAALNYQTTQLPLYLLQLCSFQYVSLKTDTYTFIYGAHHSSCLESG